jgi:membrane protein
VRGSWIEDLMAELRAVDFSNAVVLLGSTLLLSVLPLLVLLSSLADERIDSDLSRHIGLDRHGAHIVEGLFRTSPAHAAGSLALGIVVAFAGATAFAGSLRSLYETVFLQESRGWRGLPRLIVWLTALVGALIAGAVYDEPLRRGAGVVVRDAASFALVALFFWWTMHFLLAGRVPWPRLVRTAFVTAVLWLVLTLFSSLYFSAAIVSEHALYGTLGVVFILMTWLIAVAAVIVLGAAGGAVWEKRARRSASVRASALQAAPDDRRPADSEQRPRDDVAGVVDAQVDPRSRDREHD